MALTAEAKPKDVELKAQEKPEFEDDDYVTYVRTNWGTKHIAADKVDYAEHYTFTGGIARNVPYSVAKVWHKRSTIGGRYFRNNITVEEIARAMGRNPESPENIAAAIQMITPDKVAAVMGDEAALKLAKQLQLLIQSKREN